MLDFLFDFLWNFLFYKIGGVVVFLITFGKSKNKENQSHVDIALKSIVGVFVFLLTVFIIYLVI